MLLDVRHVIELFSVIDAQYLTWILFNFPLNSAIKSYLALSPKGIETYIFLLVNSAKIIASPMFPLVLLFIK